MNQIIQRDITHTDTQTNTFNTSRENSEVAHKLIILAKSNSF